MAGRPIRTLRSLRQIETLAALRQRRRICRASLGVSAAEEDASSAMYVSTADIVRQTIRHAQRMSRHGVHGWPIARQALTKILADLEARSPGDPSLRRLRAYIRVHNRAWSRDSD